MGIATLESFSVWIVGAMLIPRLHPIVLLAVVLEALLYASVWGLGWALLNTLVAWVLLSALRGPVDPRRVAVVIGWGSGGGGLLLPLALLVLTGFGILALVGTPSQWEAMNGFMVFGFILASVVGGGTVLGLTWVLLMRAFPLGSIYRTVGLHGLLASGLAVNGYLVCSVVVGSVFGPHLLWGRDEAFLIDVTSRLATWLGLQ